MSYRQSSYDPLSTALPSGPALRPFNWVQWTGVALIVAGGGFGLLFLLGRLGVIPLHPRAVMVPMFQLPFFGMLMINSRRAPPVDQAPELAPARRRWLIGVGTACAVILGLAAVVSIVTSA